LFLENFKVYLIKNEIIYNNNQDLRNKSIVSFFIEKFSMYL